MQETYTTGLDDIIGSHSTHVTVVTGTAYDFVHVRDNHKGDHRDDEMGPSLVPRASV